ncbi:hypothetical protein TRFO_04873 [Tritrichomonas foetus]|uniref:Uncharacterized protein n=1 Tax=Tritrichomonas foetus TaxID=1144522 RepID=A0A1J4K9X8_9EUKA|nr:hypothetical protein TRFO_04873 [Tritrichomonas foetus]|eukprot:OHT08273.1 hypothetical protein TRFO_04873 [Tritrichomonas foetus]
MLGNLIVPILKHPICTTIMISIIFESYVPKFMTVNAIFIATFLARSTQGIYISFLHQAVVAFFICLVSEPLCIFLERDQDKNLFPIEIALKAYIKLFSYLYFLVLVILISLRFISEETSNFILEKSKGITDISYSICISRVFSIMIPLFPKIDTRLFLVITVIVALWPQIVDSIARYITKKRSATCFSSYSFVLKIGFSTAFAFSLCHESPISMHMGLFPSQYASLILFFTTLAFGVFNE